MSNPKIAVSWNSSCGGCDESIVDLEHKILDVAALVEFVFWPCAMDFKYDDLEKLNDGEIAVSLINGAIQNTEQERVVKLLRRKSGLVIAFGSCASLGGVPSLLNLKSRQAAFDSSYRDGPSTVNEGGVVPLAASSVDGYCLTLPELFATVFKLDDVIDVDYYLPGCPPTAGMIGLALGAVLEGRLPAKGSILASGKSLCRSCDRNATKPENVAIKEIKRIHEIVADPETCFLAQGVICMGPATRDGCDYPCVRGNMPCTGCLGPADGGDQGAKMTGALAALWDADDEISAARIANGVVDPAGTFYRYSMAASLLGRKRQEKNG